MKSPKEKVIKGVRVMRAGTRDVEVLIKKKGMTVQDVLDKANVVLTRDLQVYYNGEPVDLESIVEPGDSIQIVQDKTGGVL